MSQPRPRTSQSSLSSAPLSKYLLSYKKFASNADHPPSLASRFTRNRYKQEHSLELHTEQAYNTRNGVLNTAMLGKRPGGNGYCSILRQKRAIVEARDRETAVDRRVREAKAEYSPLLDRSSVSDLHQSVFLTSEHHSYSRLSPILPTGSETTKIRVVPTSFQHAAIRCACEVAAPCLCGKRELRSYSSASLNLTHEKLADILSTCETIAKETTSTKAEMREQLGQVRQKLNLYSRHTNLIIMGQQRAKYFNLRKKFQVATRVTPTQRHEKSQFGGQIAIPTDIEVAMESDPSLFALL